jgi:hypothetical protein
MASRKRCAPVRADAPAVKGKLPQAWKTTLAWGLPILGSCGAATTLVSGALLFGQLTQDQQQQSPPTTGRRTVVVSPPQPNSPSAEPFAYPTVGSGTAGERTMADPILDRLIDVEIDLLKSAGQNTGRLAIGGAVILVGRILNHQRRQRFRERERAHEDDLQAALEPDKTTNVLELSGYCENKGKIQRAHVLLEVDGQDGDRQFWAIPTRAFGSDGRLEWQDGKFDAKSLGGIPLQWQSQQPGWVKRYVWNLGGKTAQPTRKTAQSTPGEPELIGVTWQEFPGKNYMNYSDAQGQHFKVRGEYLDGNTGTDVALKPTDLTPSRNPFSIH